MIGAGDRAQTGGLRLGKATQVKNSKQLKSFGFVPFESHFKHIREQILIARNPEKQGYLGVFCHQCHQLFECNRGGYMAKRFTDTEKWKNPWFRDLDNEYRWLWIFILDECDAAGIWRVDWAMASFCVGSRINSVEAEKMFEDKIIIVDHDKWFIPSFVAFQYGELRDDSRPHQAVIKKLLAVGIDPKTLTLSIGYPKSIHTLKDKDKEQDKEKDQDRGSAEGGKFKPDLAAVYKRYPRKLGKSKGLAKLKTQIKGPSDLEALSTALDHFLAHHQRKGTEADYIPHFVTWVNSWADWLDPETGQAEDFSPTSDAEARERALFEQAAGE